jgi:hypothetical protein
MISDVWLATCMSELFQAVYADRIPSIHGEIFPGKDMKNHEQIVYNGVDSYLMVSDASPSGRPGGCSSTAASFLAGLEGFDDFKGWDGKLFGYTPRMLLLLNYVE